MRTAWRGTAGSCAEEPGLEADVAEEVLLLLEDPAAHVEDLPCGEDHRGDVDDAGEPFPGALHGDGGVVEGAVGEAGAFGVEHAGFFSGGEVEGDGFGEDGFVDHGWAGWLA